MQHRGRAGFDPGSSLRLTVEDALPSEDRPVLDAPLEVLGKRIFGWLVNKLRGVGIGDPLSEAEDAFQQLCLRVHQRLRRWGGDVSDGWFWRVANSVFLNHLDRKLSKRKNEEALERSDEQNDHLAQALTGSVAIEQPDNLADESVDNLVLRCLDRIPPRMAELLYLDLIERLPTKAIVAKMGLEPKSFAACKAKAIMRLRDEIKKAIVSP